MSVSLAGLGDWRNLPFFGDQWPGIEADLAREPRTILPPADQIFAALEMTQPSDARVVILGQDPYPTKGHAHGLAFSAEAETKPLPRSLSNIFKEMRSDIGCAPTSPDLRFWARQGVLLLNTALTVPEGNAGGHAKLGWDHLIAQILARLDETPRAWLLWGKAAQSRTEPLRNPDHLKIASAHPSPLSANRGFFGSRPFSQVNEWLEGRNEAPIRWSDAT